MYRAYIFDGHYTQIENGIEVSDYDETWTSDIGPINVAYGDIRTYAKAIKDTYTKYYLVYNKAENKAYGVSYLEDAVLENDRYGDTP